MKQANEVVNTLVRALINDRVKLGWDRDGARSYTLGYIQSTLVSVIEQMPKKKQKEILDGFTQKIFEIAAE